MQRTNSRIAVDLGELDPRGLEVLPTDIVVSFETLDPARRRLLARAIAALLAKEPIAVGGLKKEKQA